MSSSKQFTNSLTYYGPADLNFSSWFGGDPAVGGDASTYGDYAPNVQRGLGDGGSQHYPLPLRYGDVISLSGLNYPNEYVDVVPQQFDADQDPLSIFSYYNTKFIIDYFGSQNVSSTPNCSPGDKKYGDILNYRGSPVYFGDNVLLTMLTPLDNKELSSGGISTDADPGPKTDFNNPGPFWKPTGMVEACSASGHWSSEHHMRQYYPQNWGDINTLWTITTTFGDKCQVGSCGSNAIAVGSNQCRRHVLYGDQVNLKNECIDSDNPWLAGGCHEGSCGLSCTVQNHSDSKVINITVLNALGEIPMMPSQTDVLSGTVSYYSWSSGSCGLSDPQKDRNLLVLDDPQTPTKFISLSAPFTPQSFVKWSTSAYSLSSKIPGEGPCQTAGIPPQCGWFQNMVCDKDSKTYVCVSSTEGNIKKMVLVALGIILGMVVIYFFFV